MKPKQRLHLLFAVLLLASLACRAVLGPSTPTPLPEASPQPSSTPRATPSRSATRARLPKRGRTLTPTFTPTLPPTLTEDPFGEFQVDSDAIVALYYWRADWREDGHTLKYLRLLDCTLTATGAANAFSGGTPAQAIIGRFSWLEGDGVYSLKLGDNLFIGNLVAQYGTSDTSCRNVIESLLKSVRAFSKYAQAGKCRYAPKQRLKVGDTAVMLSSSYLRMEPRWAEDTLLHLVDPTQKLTIQVIGGPVCAIYNQGEYSYWQVRLSSNELGWIAEGDLKEYYLAPKE